MKVENIVSSINKFNEIDHYVSLKKKQEKDWYVPLADYLVTKMESINDKSKIDDYLNAANGVYSDETKKKFLTLINANRYQDEIKDLDSMDEIDIIAPITRRMIGEFIRQPVNDYECVVKDPDITMSMNNAVNDRISEILLAKLTAELDKITGEAEKRGEKSEDAIANLDIEAEIEKVKSDYFDKEAAKAKAIVDSMIEREELDKSFKQQFMYLYATEQVYTLIDTDNDEVVPIHMSPKDYYRFPSGIHSEVEHDIAGMYKNQISVYEFKEKFKDELDNEDMDYIDTAISSTSTSDDINRVIKSRIATYGLDPLNTSGDISSAVDNITNIFKETDTIEEIRLLFRSKRTFQILTLSTPEGATTTTIVDEHYKLRPEFGDIELTKHVKDEIYQMYILGGIKTGVYTKPKPLKYQREYLSNVNNVMLPVIGNSGLLINILNKPISYRILPFNIMYRFMHIKILSEVAKFQGFLNLIPESILNDSEHFTQKQRLDYIYESNFLIFDDSTANTVAMQSIRTIGQYHGEYIKSLREIKDSLKAEAWEMADMNNERYGDIDTQGGKGVTQEAIIRVSTGSLLLFTTFDDYLERLYQAVSDYGRLVYTDGIQVEYKDKDGKLININLDHETLLNRDIGIHFKKSPIEREKREYLKNYVIQAAMQNNEFLLAIESLDNDNISDVKLLAKKLDEANKEREKYYKELEHDIETKKLEREKEKQELELKGKEDVVRLKGEYDLLLKDKDIYMKMLEFNSFNPDDTKFDDELAQLEKDIKRAELEIKKSQKQVLDAKRNEIKNKPKAKTK